MAQTIIESGLGNYYLQRDTLPTRQEAIPVELHEQIALYNDISLQKKFVYFESEAVRDAALIVEGITCSACIWLIERHLSRIPGILAAHINYATHRARIKWDNTRTTLPDILEAILAIGYRAYPYDRTHEENLRQKTRKTMLTRLGIAGLSMMQVMMYAVPVYLADPGSISQNMQNLMRWASLILTLPVVLYCAVPFYRASWRELRQKRAAMDLPVSLSILLTFIASSWATFTGRGEVYFDSIAMFVFLLLGGRYLETVARLRTQAATEALVRLIPAFAHYLPHYPQQTKAQEITVSQLQVGDMISIKPGEVIPCDAIIVEGMSQVDESLLSGESRPLTRQENDRIIAGSTNLFSPLIARVSHIGEATQLSAIVRLLDHAQAEKPVLARLADRIAGWFVLVLLSIALITFVFWWQHDPAQALWITVAVLVISCPCALSLATPAALSAACGRLSREGLLVARAAGIEALSQCTDVILDKTGTLSEGRLRLQQVITRDISAQEARQLAASLETQSEHPIAEALQREKICVAQAVRNYPGQGIRGAIAGQDYVIGAQDFVNAFCQQPLPDAWRNLSTQDSLVYLACRDKWLAVFFLRDQLRIESALCVAGLQQLGLRVHLLSGDSQEVVQHVAQTLHITDFAAAQLPQDKLNYMARLQKANRRVLMLGDGVNDAPVLAAADVSIAMGNGADIAHAAGDIILLSNNLENIPKAVIIARKARAIIRQNLYWALLYNALALPLAIAGYVTPWLAGIGMAASSILVVMNALRLYPRAPAGAK